jgi:hypothetical protein
VQIVLAVEPIDLRRGHDGLVTFVRERWRADPYNGTLFVFYGRRMDRVKVLFFSAGGFVVYYKRLGTPWKGGMWNVNLRRKEGTPISLRRSSPSGGDPRSDTWGDEVRR